MRTIDECIKILEVAKCNEVVKCKHEIPIDVLDYTIKYLKDLKHKEILDSWDRFPESMGR